MSDAEKSREYRNRVGGVIFERALGPAASDNDRIAAAIVLHSAEMNVFTRVVADFLTDYMKYQRGD